jgi:site-specific DNA-methyltransferase (adenine-specific)
MSVERVERKDGTVVWRVHWRQGGRNRSKVLGRKRDAEAFDAELVRKKRTGELAQLDSGKELLADFGEEWWRLYAEPNLAKSTLQVYAVQWDVHVLPRLRAVSRHHRGSSDPRDTVTRMSSQSPANIFIREDSHALPLGAVVVGDAISILKSFPDASVHLILSDIPYGIGMEDWDVLHANSNSALRGVSPAQERAGAVFKSRGKPINGWSEADRRIPAEYQEWCSRWASDWFRILKPGGSVLVFAGRRLAHRCSVALEDAGFSAKDVLGWVRPRAPHRAQRLSVVYERRGDAVLAEEWRGWRVGNLRPIFEPILWFTKPYKIGTTIADNVINHGVGAFNEEALSRYTGGPENLLELGFARGEAGLHPTQKPVALMSALIELTTKPGQVVLDPFAGSGSTLVAAQMLSRSLVGVEIDPEHAACATARIAGASPDAASPDRLFPIA